MIFLSRLISRFIELLCANTLLMSKEKKWQRNGLIASCGGQSKKMGRIYYIGANKCEKHLGPT